MLPGVAEVVVIPGICGIVQLHLGVGQVTRGRAGPRRGYPYFRRGLGDAGEFPGNAVETKGIRARQPGQVCDTPVRYVKHHDARRVAIRDQKKFERTTLATRKTMAAVCGYGRTFGKLWQPPGLLSGR